jgi:osmoprotectant transport system ATP-binding protein
VVVGPEEDLLGWVDLHLDQAGEVADHLVPFDVQLPLGTSLRVALGEMLQHDVRWIPVVETGRYLGVITPNRLHAAMRRSVGGHPVED